MHPSPNHVRQPSSIAKPIQMDHNSPVFLGTLTSGPRAAWQSHNPRPSVTEAIVWPTDFTDLTHDRVTPISAASNAFEEVSTSCNGALGTGATVVRTPQDALRGTNIHLTPEGSGERVPKPHGEWKKGTRQGRRRIPSSGSDQGTKHPSPRHTLQTPPPSPHERFSIPLSKSTPDLRKSSASSLAVPPVPRLDRSSPPSSASRTQQMSEYNPPIDVSSCFSDLPSPMQPAFAPILVSQPLPPDANRAVVVVSLETATVTYRTTLETLTSRPSHLASYCALLLSSAQDGDNAGLVHAEVSSKSVDVSSVFRGHHPLQLRIFLDRPSPPYVHILAYLRNSSSNSPALPRAVRLRSHLQLVTTTSNISDTSDNRERLEALLDLREEAKYLGLDELQGLCTDELTNVRLIRTRLHPQTYSSAHPRARASSFGSSSSSMHSLPTHMEPVHELPESLSSPPPTPSLSSPLPPRLPLPSSTLHSTHGRPPSAPAPSRKHSSTPFFASAMGTDQRTHEDRACDARREVFSMSARPPPPGWF